MGKRSAGRSPARSTDDLVRTAHSRWMQVASDRSRWKSIGEIFLGGMFSSGQLQAMMITSADI